MVVCFMMIFNSKEHVGTKYYEKLAERWPLLAETCSYFFAFRYHHIT